MKASEAHVKPQRLRRQTIECEEMFMPHTTFVTFMGSGDEMSSVSAGGDAYLAKLSIKQRNTFRFFEAFKHQTTHTNDAATKRDKGADAMKKL